MHFSTHSLSDAEWKPTETVKFLRDNNMCLAEDLNQDDVDRC